MSVPKLLDEVFRELKHYKNPDNTPVLQEITHPNNGTRTLFIYFANIDVRDNFMREVRLSTLSHTRGANSLKIVLYQLGFKNTAPHGKTYSELRLTDHAGHNVTINAYQNIILPSFTLEESNHINRFAERIRERKYQHIRDALRNYQSPVHSPSRSPQPSTSGIQQNSLPQVGGPMRNPRQRQHVNTEHDPYELPPLSIPRPRAPRPQIPLSPQRQVSPIRQYTSSEDLDFAVEVMRSHAKTPSPRR
ncbi:hypothetical protein [Xenorhabdus bovienii]|uniref:hypothetical protein n=1 Tax=Xenorhabdus bovienii TaxID=40576 RepID=UPI0023B34A6E|nr:hypothetical protein [Xenorhabdus bovienii]MDE9553546.1 hypothetical protein [Xenorhabdus bovienii]